MAFPSAISTNNKSQTFLQCQSQGVGQSLGTIYAAFPMKNETLGERMNVLTSCFIHRPFLGPIWKI